MLIQVNECNVINTNDIKCIEKSSVFGDWYIYFNNESESSVYLDFQYCTLSEIILASNGVPNV